MKPYERRREQSYPYYKVATWDPRSMTYRDGKVAFATLEEAVESTTDWLGEGRKTHRISVVTEKSRKDIWPPLGASVFSTSNEDIAGVVCGYKDTEVTLVAVEGEDETVRWAPPTDLEISGGN